MSPTTRIAGVVMFALVTVEFGGWSLLGLLTSENGLSDFEEQYFRAGHGHAGVLLVLALVFLVLLERTGFGSRAQIWLSVILLIGILAQSGGFFLHMVMGEEGSPSAGTWVTRAGAVLLAVALISVGVGLVRQRPVAGTG